MSECKEMAISLHDQLVAYVHAITEEPETRSCVWVEHSYARSESAASGTGSGAGAGDVRELLAPRRPAVASRDHDEWLDVESAQPPPALPAYLDDSQSASADEDEKEEEDEQWEERAAALAPSATHARLLASALEALRVARLARLVGGWGARRESVRAAAARLRRALAPMWAWGGPVPQRPAAWLHATLLASLPRPIRVLYDETVAELRRATPRLVERLTAGRPAPPPPPASPPPTEESAPVAADSGGPWLLWLCSSSAEKSSEARWARHLRALLHTRVWRPPHTNGVRLAPDAHCASLVAAARKALTEVLIEARRCGVSTVVAGGAGAGAALAADAAGASDPPPSGLLLLAPPLLTAEGARDVADDALRELRTPALLVVGTAGAQSWRGAACEVGGRVLVVHGADDALRLPRAARRRLRLPQRALDAAVADECARWCAELASSEPEMADYAHLPPVDRIDIMQMPIVFADDEPPSDRLTVTSGDKYSRVLVAKKGVLGRRSLRPPLPL